MKYIFLSKPKVDFSANTPAEEQSSYLNKVIHHACSFLNKIKNMYIEKEDTYCNVKGVPIFKLEMFFLSELENMLSNAKEDNKIKFKISTIQTVITKLHIEVLKIKGLKKPECVSFDFLNYIFAELDRLKLYLAEMLGINSNIKKHYSVR